MADLQATRQQHLKRVYDVVTASRVGGISVWELCEVCSWNDDYVVDLLEQLEALGLIERFQPSGLLAKSGILKGWHFRVKSQPE